MKFSVLALDYDGTIARDGVLDPDVKDAIMEARARGIVAVLVTGRILSDLKQVSGGVDFVDAIVAENGAVLEFHNGHSILIGQPPPQVFLDELRRRGVEFKTGQCVVEMDAGSAQKVLEAIEQLELPLVLLFNHSRLMVLPQSISKGTGLRESLQAFRLSVHNAIAIGDAENDHDLLDTCEVGVAVSWGSPTLQKIADEILQGEGPHAVAAYIRRVAQEMRLPRDRSGRHRIAVGTAENGDPIAIAIQGRNILVIGEPQSGKSWATGLACEQMILQGYSVCVIDPEGEYGALESLPGVVVLGGEGPLPDIPDVARALRHFDMSVVVDLSRAPYEEKVKYLDALLPMLVSLRRSTGLPHRIVVDEAHYFLRQPNVKELLDLELGAYTIVTYRPSDLHPDLRKDIEVVVAKRLTHPQEVQTLLSMVKTGKIDPGWTTALGSLATDEAALLPGSENVEGKLRRFKLLPRLTQHVRHKTKYFDLQLLPGGEFVFTDHGRPIGSSARSLKQFVSLLGGIPAALLGEHARRGDFSRWIAEVFHDHRMASDIRKIEQRVRLGYLDDIRESMATLIQERYSLSRDKTL
jgi:hydroxymethylpyrimidine pyrophosphatase-like HAD family hydrolase